MADTAPSRRIELAVELTIAWLGNPNSHPTPETIPLFLKTAGAALAALERPGTISSPPGPAFSPAVSIRESLESEDHLLSLIDGKPYKMLRRHLMLHGLTPDAYRVRYDLPPDYPMTAPSYSRTRRAISIAAGLGRKRRPGPAVLPTGQ